MQRNNNSATMQCSIKPGYTMIMVGSYLLNVAAISHAELRADGAVIHMLTGERVALLTEEADAFVAMLGEAFDGKEGHPTLGDVTISTDLLGIPPQG